MSALLPCPFCGSYEVSIAWGDGPLVMCRSCLCQTEVYEEMEKCIKAWNTRANIPDSATALRLARDVLEECIHGLNAHCAIACGQTIDKATAALAALKGEQP